MRIGIIPWAQFGNANATFTWGWAFGGSFYDPKTEKITADNPGVVKAMEWMTGYAKKFDVKRVNAFSQGFGSRDQNPFYIGQVAMQCLHISQLDDIKQYAPSLDYGLTFLPAPAGGETAFVLGGRLVSGDSEGLEASERGVGVPALVLPRPQGDAGGRAAAVAAAGVSEVAVYRGSEKQAGL